MEQSVIIFFRICVLSLFLTACGGGSSSSTITTPPPPGTPVNLQISSHDGFTTLHWDSVADASSYSIYWSTQPGVTKTSGIKIEHLSTNLNHGGLVNGQSYYYVVAAKNEYGESGITNAVSGQPVDGGGIDDPLFADQWHLDNTGQAGNNGISGQSGEDINVVPAWSAYRGEGIRIAVVDDGLQINHPDLVSNVVNDLSYNYLNNSNDPSPSNPDDAHGTAVGGIIAARDKNDIGARGVAPRANLVGYNLLQYFTLSTAADAMTRGNQQVHIYSNSWGAEDYTGILEDAPFTWKSAITSGLTTGRNGLGNIYVFAAGNGRGVNPNPVVDNSNYDGMANYRGIIAVAALNDKGSYAGYSEPGANILVSAYGGEFCTTHTISTTDLTGTAGFNNNFTTGDYADRDYTKCMNGTSAATPMVSGAIALMLQANPNLSWRDVRYILATTARQNHFEPISNRDPDWIQNGANIWVNQNYGFGVINTEAAVTAAVGWTNLGTELSFNVNATPSLQIPDNNATGVSSDIIINASGINKIETVEVTFSATNHAWSCDLEIILTSPADTESVLAETHDCIGNTVYDNWVFSSVRHLDEIADGTWTLTVRDGAAANTGKFQSWELKIYGHADP